jgi:excisionase family DNA binding protein
MKKVFTTGQAARIVKVAPRTICHWFDSGRLEGYRIPGSQDRRIPRDALIRFLKEHNMPLGELAEQPRELAEDYRNEPAPPAPADPDPGPVRKAFTVRDVARICKVPPHVVGKWLDSRRLRGVRGGERGTWQVARPELLRFLKAHGMPLGELEGQEGPDDGVYFHDTALTTGQVVYPAGPDALAWLADQADPEAFPVERFRHPDGSTAAARQLVERLFDLGAERVAIPEWALRTEAGRTVATGLVVVLPAEGRAREALVWLCAGELARGRYAATWEPGHMVGCRVVELAW